MRGEFLLEIGTEEIPARFLPPAMEQMKDSMAKRLADARLSFSSIQTFATPRRLVLGVFELLLKQEDEERRVVGPPERAAYDASGNPTRAAQGFADAHGVPVSELRLVETKRGRCVAVFKKVPGKSARELLAEFLPDWILSLSFPKSMRWGTSRFAFARPIHWILALLEGEVVPFELGSLRSGSLTYGHRFMAPAPIPIRSFSEYCSKLRDAYVIVDPEERGKLLEERIHQAAAERGGNIVPDPDLCRENAFLVELPSAVCGRFHESFLELPDEVLVTAMREHQRYFAVEDSNGRLMPLFVAVNNTRTRDDAVVTKGHERVLKARLEDARFFFREDTKKPLQDHAESLKSVLFQKKLGTSYEKMERFRELALFMADRVCPSKREVVARVATLCKADLVTEMVGEFPSLQGTMGRIYARLSGESEEVAEGIFEHYLPRFANDVLPTSPAGALVGMADRLDTICGCFGIGLIPTGAADPYALRRHTLAILHILLHKEYPLDLLHLVEKSLSLLGDRIERSVPEVQAEVLAFFRTRFHHLLTGRGFPYDVVDAVLSVHHRTPPEALKRVEALNKWRSLPEFEPLAISFKRVVNILKDQPPGGEVDPALFEDPAEEALWSAFQEARESVAALLEEHDYEKSLNVIFNLKKPIDRFFDTVLVMTDDASLRRNRLNLLHRLADLFRNIGDFSRFSI